MLVRFSSTATESILMFEEAAAQLIRMMGASGRIPGALYPADVQGAIAELRSELAQLPPAPTGTDEEEDEEDTAGAGGGGRRVTLSMRAVPLIDLMERAAAHEAEVMWAYDD